MSADLAARVAALADEWDSEKCYSASSRLRALLAVPTIEEVLEAHTLDAWEARRGKTVRARCHCGQELGVGEHRAHVADRLREAIRDGAR